ncbi:MAG TPA: dihydropteroate synthase [Verrucomicrobiales bacterium]|nr:dihydropteroate synthase [Verrucomicrobiales bacterium]
MLSIESLAALHQAHPAAAAARVAEFSLGTTRFEFNSRPALMGVINLSADSWYRESVCLDAESAIRRGRILRAQGAAILDIGAESTLAHASRVDESAQNHRLLPVIRTLAAEGAVVSVETYHPVVTRACLEAGARILNLTGVDGSAEMFRMVADHDAGVIICFVQGAHVRDVGNLDLGKDPIGTLHDFFARQIDLATRQGVRRIFIDPGLGFYYRNLQDSAARIRHQSSIFLNTFRLRTLGHPVCNALPHAFEYFGEEVRSAEPYFAVLAALGKTDLFRTHEVPRVKAVLDSLNVL